MPLQKMTESATIRGVNQRWILVAILLLAFALRVVELADFPPGLRYDELQNYVMAGRVLDGQRPFYFAESWGHEPLFHYLQAAVLTLVNVSGWSLRLPAVFFGLLAVPATWLAGRALFNKTTGLVAAAAMAISFWAIFYSRVGLRLGMVVPFFCLLVFSLWRLLNRSQPRSLEAIAGGLLLGALVYIYPSGRAGLLFLVASILYVVLFHHQNFKRSWRQLVLLAAVGVAVATPLFVFLARSPDLQQRGDQLSAPGAALLAGDPRPALVLLGRAAAMFVWQGEQDWLYNAYGRPIFDPFTAIFFVIGLAVCLWRWRRLPYGLLLLWLGAGLAPGVLTLPAASLTHTIVAQPAAHLMLALGLLAAAQVVTRRWPYPAAIGLTAVVLFIYGVLSANAYFRTWSGHPEVRELYQGGIRAVAQDLADRSPPGPVAVGAPYVDYWQPWNAVAFELSRPANRADVRWFNPAGGWVWPHGPSPVTYYFPADPLGPQSFDPELRALFEAGATPLSLENDAFSAYQLDDNGAFEQQLEAVAAQTRLSWPPDLAGLPQPVLPVIWAGRFALLGADLAIKGVKPGEQVRLVTYWEVLAADPSPVVAFTHITSDGVDIWGQQDWLDVRLAGLQPGDRFVQVHTLPLQTGTPPGIYRIQLGLYRPETLERLPIETPDGQPADRLWLGTVTVSE